LRGEVRVLAVVGDDEGAARTGAEPALSPTPVVDVPPPALGALGDGALDDDDAAGAEALDDDDGEADGDGDAVEADAPPVPVCATARNELVARARTRTDAIGRTSTRFTADLRRRRSLL
jgi:hypothetical protein